MSRVGRKAVIIPEKVKAVLQGRMVNVEGPKGKLSLEIHPRIKVEIADNKVSVSRPTDQPMDRALHGLTRSLIQNMVEGVTNGFKKELEIVGVGYKAAVKNKALNLLIGFTHPIDYKIPEGVEVKCPNPTRIEVSGIDKHMVWQVAADIRAFHKPEPYKGKGIHYVGEVIRRKQGKSVG